MEPRGMKAMVKVKLRNQVPKKVTSIIWKCFGYLKSDEEQIKIPSVNKAIVFPFANAKCGKIASCG